MVFMNPLASVVLEHSSLGCFVAGMALNGDDRLTAKVILFLIVFAVVGAVGKAS
jgi:hypothetical protein